MADRSRIKRAGAERAGQHVDLERVEHVEGVTAAPDRALAPLGRIVLALQGEQGIYAADGTQRRRGLRLLWRLLLGDRKTPGRGAPGRGRGVDPYRGVRSEDAHGGGLQVPAQTRPECRKGGPVWLRPGKGPAQFAGRAARATGLPLHRAKVPK